MSKFTQTRWMVLALALGLLAGVKPAQAQPTLPAAFDKAVPDSLQDLQDIEKHVQKLVDKVLPCTVCLRIGQGQGSGVIVDREGHILTAGHVSGDANQDAVIVMPNGSKIKGKTLGANNGIDSGMVLITEKVDFSHLEMAKSADVKKGQWCLALGHPGGHKPGRDPVVRLGRVLAVKDNVIITDCTLVGGDSGGPLFDMHGRVIGIHSRIGGKVSSNLHVPVDTYRETWARLAAGEVWGNPEPFFSFGKPAEEAYLGVKAKVEKTSLKILSVTPASPAEKAGLMMNDTILKINNHALASVNDLTDFLKTQRPGARITIHVQRGAETVTVPVVLGKRSE
jgi:serine protease Do